MFKKLIYIAFQLNPYCVIKEWHSIVQIYHSFIIYFPPEGHLGCFQFGAIMNNGAINILVQIILGDFPHKYASISLR